MGINVLIITMTHKEAVIRNRQFKTLGETSKAVGIGQSVPCISADLIICPISSLERLYSTGELERFHRWFLETVTVRLSPNGFIHWV